MRNANKVSGGKAEEQKDHATRIVQIYNKFMLAMEEYDIKMRNSALNEPFDPKRVRQRLENQ